MKLIDFKWNRSPAKIAEMYTDDEVKLFLANEAKRLMDPYVPANNLAMAQNARAEVEQDPQRKPLSENIKTYTVSGNTGAGVIEYMSPYAHYQFEGVLYVDKKTGVGAFTNGEGLFWSRPGKHKKRSGRKLEHSKFRHPLATSHWDKAMKAARMPELEKSLELFLKKRKRQDGR